MMEQDSAFERDRRALPPIVPLSYGPHMKVGGKVLNIWGLVYAVTSMLTALVMFPFMIVLSKVSDISGNGKVPTHPHFNSSFQSLIVSELL